MLNKVTESLQDWKVSLFFLVIYGGTGFVNYLRRKKFSITVLVADVFSSLVSGFLTFFVMTSQGYPEHVCLAVSFLVAHNATRLLFLIDKYIEAKADEIIDTIDLDKKG